MADEYEIKVPQNRYEMETVRRTRPYLSSEKERERWMVFQRLFQLILESRIDELNGRYNQIYYILEIKRQKLYLVEADTTISTHRPADYYFWDWLRELYDTHKIPIANESVWKKVETNIAKCVGGGLPLEKAIAVAAVGEKSLKDLEDHGVLVTKQLPDGTLGYERGPRATEVIGDTPVTDYLDRIAESKSSRGATMMVRYDLGKGKAATIGNIWTDKKEPEMAGMKQIFIEVEEIDTATGEKTPYAFRLLYEKETPPEVVKYLLRSAGTERFARVAFE